MDTTNGFLEAGKHSRTSGPQWNQTFFEIIFLRKRLHFCQASLFIFVRSYFVKALHTQYYALGHDSDVTLMLPSNRWL